MTPRSQRTKRSGDRYCRPLAPALALIVITLITYLPALKAGFIWDDDDYVTQNAELRNRGGLKRIWLKPGTTPQYYPLVFTTFWFEYRLWGADPAGYHVVNVLLHGLNAALLWIVLRGLKVPGAWVAAALFALHPVHVETAAWITELKNTLSTLFYLAALLAWGRFDEFPRGQRAWGWYGASLALFLCALLSKTVTCSLPVAILILIWYRRGRLSRRELAALVPFLIVGALTAWITISLEKRMVGAGGSPWDISPLAPFGIAGRAVWFYAGTLLFPLRLSFVYPRWDFSESDWRVLLPLAAMTLIVMLLWRGRKRFGRGPVTGVLLFFVTLFPALGFVAVFPFRYSFVADHFQYLASAGLIAVVVGACYRLLGRGVADRVFMPLLIIFAVLTFHWTFVYRDLDALWRDTLRKNPRAWIAHNNLGVLLADRGEVLRPVFHLRETLKLRPRFAKAYNNLGVCLTRVGRFAEALRAHAEAVRLEPERTDLRVGLANLLAELGRYAEAARHFRKALDLNPQSFEAARDFAWMLATTGGDPGMAVRLAERAVRLAREASPLALDTLAAAYANAGRFDDALRAADLAVRTADSRGLASLAREIKRRRSLYAAGRPVRRTRKVP